MKEKIIKILQDEKAIERIAEVAHDKWCGAKKQQGYHSPALCTSEGRKEAAAKGVSSEVIRTTRWCNTCHNMIMSFDELAPSVKSGRLKTARGIIEALLNEV